MKIVSISMVKNEADVIESFVRHNLQHLSEMRLIDHGSTDRTPEILRALQQEGLPLRVERSELFQQLQDVESNRLAQQAFADGADWVIPLDADEFIELLPAVSLADTLANQGDHACLSWPWVSMVPTEADDASEADPVRRIRHRLAKESVPTVKLLLGRAVLAHRDWSLITGNHQVAVSDGSKSVQLLPRHPCPSSALRHYPVRSTGQFIGKVIIGWLAIRQRLMPNSMLGGHFRAAYQRILSGQEPEFRDMTLYAMNYQTPGGATWRELADDPLAVQHTLCHTRAEEVNPLARVLQWLGTAPLGGGEAVVPVQFDQTRAPTAAVPIESNPHAPEAVALFNTANAQYRDGAWLQALASYSAALAADATLAPAHLGRARCLVQLGEATAAGEAFADLLRLDPANYSGWLEAGHLQRQCGEAEQALLAYDRAIALAPSRYEAALGKIRVLEQAGRLQEAEAALQQAVLAARGVSQAALRAVWHRVGKYRLEQGALAPALQALRQALALARQDGDPLVQRDEAAEICIDIAELLLKDGQTARAHELLGQASASERESTLNRLAQTAFRYNLWTEAIEVSRRNLALRPQSALAHWNLAHLLAECWQMGEARTLLAQAEALAPMPGALTMRAQMAGRLGDADAALALYREYRAQHPKDRAVASSVAMCSLYCDSLDAPAVGQLHRELFAHLGQGARAPESFVRAPLKDASGRLRRIRLGLISADFHFQHPVNIFMQPVLRELDPTRFEVVVYFTGVYTDAQTQLAKRRAARWVEATHLNDAQLARQIDADGIDLLMDLSGHTGHNRMALFAQRAAPVQVSYLGYPGSTGVPNIDWLIGDAVVTPPGCEPLYSEKIARLPGTVFCFAPEDDYPSPNFDASFAQRPLTFGSFNNVPKLTPHTLRLWGRILAALPGSRLLLKAPSFRDPAAIAAFSERLLQEGIAPDRVVFRGPVGLADMMAEYADVDIALDPVPYNGGTTTLQAMWMGVPVVAKEGAHFVSRMGASFMRAAGLPDWVAQDDDSYVAIAVEKARDRAALLALKRGLRERLLSHPAWDVQRHTRAIEDTLAHMVLDGPARAHPHPDSPESSLEKT